MDELERGVEAKLTKMIQSLGGYCLKWTSPGETGVPDRIAILPGGLVVFIELKRPKGGRASPKQIVWNERLNRLGHLAVFIKNEEEIATLKWQIIKKGEEA